MLKRLLRLPQKHSFFLFGPRATGKSMLLKSEFSLQETLYFDLLKQESFLEFKSDPQKLKNYIDARKENVKYIIIDEIQRIPELLDVVHQVMEEHGERVAPYFALSGSSARKLKRGGANLLGGRAWDIKIFPFTHIELGDDFDLQKALELGTLPQVYLAENKNSAQKTLRAYVSTYIEEEVKAEALVRNLQGFIKFLRVVADENGNSISFANIARETMNKEKEIKEFFQILEDTLLGFYLLPYTKTTRKIVKHPKFYFFDTGVQRALSEKLSLELNRGSEYGKAFEHWLIKEIIHLNSYLEKDYRFSFYRTHSGAEIDLIVETPAKEILAIEIKSSQIISSRDLNGLKSFADICPEAKLYCVNLNEKRYMKGKILLCHWREIMEILFPLEHVS